jgi:sugar phosphate isomerase/epimerase
MHLGMSSYSFSSAIAAGDLDILGVIDWIGTSKAEHLEIATVGLGADLLTQPELIDTIRQRAADRGVKLASYVVGASFRGPDAAEQIAEVKAQLDVAHRLGITRLRHDVVEWAWRESDLAELEKTFTQIVPACQEIADYAAERGIETSVENHGFCINNSERVRRLMHQVDRPNFGTTLDIGNFLCVDDSPVAAVAQNVQYASVVHLKDFYVRRTEPGRGWLKTLAGNYIRGSILGFGDLEIQRILRIIKESGYDGPLSIEFEGLENPLVAAEIALENAERIWAEV